MINILFHGTTKKNGRTIFKNGFKKASCFAYHLEDALMYGGSFVLMVRIDEAPGTGWEYISDEKIPPEQILNAFRFDITEIYNNVDGNLQLTKDQITEDYPGHKMCRNCEGRGQTERKKKFEQWPEDATCTVCSKCDGDGRIEQGGLKDTQPG